MNNLLVRCAFSFDTDVQRTSNNPYLQRYHDLLSIDTRKLIFVKLATALPAVGGFILQVFMRLYMFLQKLNETFSFIHLPELPLLWLLDHTGEHVIRVRKEGNKSGRMDLLHTMLEAATDQIIVVRKTINTRGYFMLFNYLQKRHSLFMLLG